VKLFDSFHEEGRFQPGTVPNRKIVERGKFDAANTQIYDHSLSLIVTDTTIKSEGVKLFLWVEISPLREMSQRVSQTFHERTECISYQGELLVVVCDPLLQCLRLKIMK
jgi:hypothetical protein